MKALVTGGGGFLGGAIVDRLLARGDSVRSLARGTYPALAAKGVECFRGDLADYEAVAKAVEGCDIVFHVAAKAGVSGAWLDYHRANVDGTSNVLFACAAHGIKKLVFTSSPSVTFDGRDQCGIDESEPYPTTFLGHYSHTKAIAEQMVLEANGDKLATVALRPHLVWGPGDNHLVPRLAARARARRLRIVGDGKNLIDSTYIDNAADAHLLAAERLDVGSTVAGKAYFISNDEPTAAAELINRLLKAAGAPQVTRTINARVAYGLGAVMEAAWHVLPLPGEAPMTRFVAKQLSTAHWFDLGAAKRDLGYDPQVTIEEGLKRLGETNG